MSLDFLEIDTAMDLIKEDIIRDLSESVVRDRSDNIDDNVSYDS
tara:strand:- start:596 stop:727 length:132 start_codon:yes stop_codon:yes gene_type:complete